MAIVVKKRLVNSAECGRLLWGSTVGSPCDSLASCYIFVLIDLDIWPLDLNFVPLLTLVQGHISTKLEVSNLLSCFEKIGDTGRTDGRDATVNAAP